MPDQLAATLAAALAKVSEWIRRELASGEPAVRNRAEEALAGALAAAVRPASDQTGQLDH